MPRITIELIRKRSEHNEGEIGTLEEISLHQESIEKIELLNQVCRHLKILLLQYNLIPKIENLNRLKNLEYLNLALNNIEVIENLEGLESLKKLDLMVNFIGDVRGVQKLRCNEKLEQLILSGNPCSDYEGYREYVVASLPQLKELDMAVIERSERIKALQRFAEVQGDVIRGYRKYAKTRETQKLRYQEKESLTITEVTSETEGNVDDEEENQKFWNGMSSNTPEDRIAISKRKLRTEEKRQRKTEKKEPKYVPKMFSPDGRPYNVNQAKIPFRLNDEDDRENIILDVALYKHLDTSYVDVDIQPNYVRVTIKGKVLQLTLPCEIVVNKSTAKRNTTTGALLITMPRTTPSTIISAINYSKEKNKRDGANRKTYLAKEEMTKRELLEIGPPRDDLDFSNIVNNAKNRLKQRSEIIEKKDFVDNADVPPLE